MMGLIFVVMMQVFVRRRTRRQQHRHEEMEEDHGGRPFPEAGGQVGSHGPELYCISRRLPEKTTELV
jgi:hypothetical protein